MVERREKFPSFGRDHMARGDEIKLTIDALGVMNPPKIVCMSCNPSTLARDLSGNRVRFYIGKLNIKYQV